MGFTVLVFQAALGPLALDIARTQGSKDEIAYAGKVLILAVLAILITAPVGAALITILGPRLLSRSEESIKASNGTVTSSKDNVHLEAREEERPLESEEKSRS